MIQFLKYTLASCLGVFLAFVIVAFLLAGMVGMLVSVGSKPTVNVSPSSVLEIEIEGQVPEKTNNLETAQFSLEQKDIIGLHEITALIRQAAKDENIDGIYLRPEQTYMGLTSYRELSEALLEFKESGKFIVAYAPYYSQGPFYLASVADEIVLNPIGSVDFRGFASFVPFFKDILEKTGVKMQIYYAGDFKSATEPFRRNSMSEENKLQTREFLEEAYENFLHAIATRRGMAPEKLRAIADSLLAQNANDAVALGLVDQIGYDADAINWIRNTMGLDADAKVNKIELYDYYLSNPIKKTSSSDRIAVVYAEGEINTGEETYGVITDHQYVDIFKDLKESDRIKAVVLRVNSPGGSILASENILQAIRDFKTSDKPLVVSMGDYAASGGYYIACEADKILADENTLTGSIGVFAMLLNVEQLLNSKLGIHFDTVRTGTYSAAFSPVFAWTEAEDNYWQKRTDGYYELFLETVANGRNMTVEDVHEVAQGRIWSGQHAVELGLVDATGSLNDAIRESALLADLDTYRITEYPRTLSPLNKMINDLTGQESLSRSARVQRELEWMLPGTADVYKILSYQGPVARLPVVVRFN